MPRTTAFLVGIAVGTAAMLLGYAAVHEAGHALVLVANGASITAFTVGPDAHVSWVGGELSTSALSLENVAGAALPALLLVALLAAYRRRVGSGVYHACYAIVVVGTTSSLLAWVGIPLLALFGDAPRGDDVTAFLDISGAPPVVVALVAACGIGGFLTLAALRGLPQTCLREVRLVRAENARRPSSRPGGPPLPPAA